MTRIVAVLPKSASSAKAAFMIARPALEIMSLRLVAQPPADLDL